MATITGVSRYCPTELVSGDGTFNTNVERHLGLANENRHPIGVVSVIGVQSTGKSTLLNRCFSTTFQEMDYTKGMTQTTKGIWIAKCLSSTKGDRKIIVIDTEGTDGAERGQEGNATFERKTTLFALAMSDVVIFNMKCDNVNLHQGSSMPLMEIVFQLMLKKFSTPRHVNLVFVLRDKNMCPLETLTEQLKRQLHQIWDKMAINEVFEDYFSIGVVAMSHYLHQSPQFNLEVVELRERIWKMVEQAQPVPASTFIGLAMENWNMIQHNTIINLELNKVTVADTYCNHVKDQKIIKFSENKSWLQIRSVVESSRKVEGFGRYVSSIIAQYLLEYDEETTYLDERPRKKHREQLILQLVKDVEPIYSSLVKITMDTILEDFRKEIARILHKRHRKFESVSNRDDYIDIFKKFAQGAHIQQADPDRLLEELENFKTELNTNESTGCILSAKLVELRKLKAWGCVTVTAMAATTLIGVPGLEAALSIPIEAAIGTAAASTTGASTVGITALIEHKKRKQALLNMCASDPILNDLYAKYKSKGK